MLEFFYTVFRQFELSRHIQKLPFLELRGVGKKKLKGKKIDRGSIGIKKKNFVFLLLEIG